MIRWCMYCQRFLGEHFPYDDPRISHGICERCDARAEQDKPVLEESAPVRQLMKQLLAGAKAGDESSCQAFASAAAARGLDAGSICVGLLQPALYQVGIDWQQAWTWRDLCALVPSDSRVSCRQRCSPPASSSRACARRLPQK